MKEDSIKNLIILVLATVSIISLSISFGKKSDTSRKEVIEVNLDRLNFCYQTLYRMIEENEPTIKLRGQSKVCDVELKNLYIKKTGRILPQTINPLLRWKMKDSDSIKNIDVLVVDNKISISSKILKKPHCHYNVIGLSWKESSFTFIPLPTQNFIVCKDLVSGQITAFYSDDIDNIQEIEDYAIKGLEAIISN